jgi:catechol 2,3-dioxygenase-like lactoylglutathione lyase family enzyme
MAVLGINHIAFRTPDPAGLRAFYLELLDAEPLAVPTTRSGPAR